MEKLVTVFMPVYNTEKYLKESIDSILNQTYKNFELLIIDDGSTDSSIDIINSYDDDRIKLFRNEKNMGLPYTRNKGLELSKGEYIAFMDSDDISKGDRLEIQVKFLDNHKDFQVVSSSCESLINNKISKPSKKIMNTEYIEINNRLIFYCCINNPTVMIRKNFFIKNNIRYKEECFVAEDYDFWVECIMNGGKIATLSKPNLIYRVGHDSLTKKSYKDYSKERKIVIDNIKKKYLKHNGIIFKDEESKLFTKIYSDPMQNINLDDIKEYKKLINKMVYMKNDYNKQGFADEIKLNLVNRILDVKCTRLEKLKIINFKIKTETFTSYIKSIIKIALLS